MSGYDYLFDMTLIWIQSPVIVQIGFRYLYNFFFFTIRILQWYASFRSSGSLFRSPFDWCMAEKVYFDLCLFPVSFQ